MGGRKTRFFNENPFLGEVPVEWRVVFAKDILIKQARPTRPGDNVVTCFRDGQVVLRSARRPDGFTIAMKEHGYQGIRVGDLVIHAMDAFAGAIGVSESNGKGSPVLSVCSVSANADAKYYSYLFRSLSYFGYIESVAKGIRERSTDYRFSEIRKTAVPLPPLPEQRAIATYLDHHVSLIDQERDLIAQKVDLLKDKRRAMIYEVVTGKRVLVEREALAGRDDWSDVIGSGPVVAIPAPRADDPFVRKGRLVDSGVEWIGEIPNHWKALRAKDIAHAEKTLNRGMACANRLSLTLDGVIRRPLDDVNGLQSSDFEGYQIFEPNDLAFKLIDLQNISTSRVGLVSERGIMSPAYIRLVLNNGVPKFAFYFFYSAYLLNVFNGMGGGVRQTLGRAELLNFDFLYPPLPEQRAIAAYLDQETALIDREVALLTQKRDLLGEKRKALIFEAVTGKLDVSA